MIPPPQRLLASSSLRPVPCRPEPLYPVVFSRIRPPAVRQQQVGGPSAAAAAAAAPLLCGASLAKCSGLVIALQSVPPTATSSAKANRFMGHSSYLAAGWLDGWMAQGRKGGREGGGGEEGDEGLGWSGGGVGERGRRNWLLA